MRFVCVSFRKLYFCDFPLKHQVQLQILCVNSLSEIPGLPYPDSFIYYIHFEITGDSCNLIGSQQSGFFKDHAIFCSKSQLFEIAPFML